MPSCSFSRYSVGDNEGNGCRTVCRSALKCREGSEFADSSVRDAASVVHEKVASRLGLLPQASRVSGLVPPTAIRIPYGAIAFG